MDQYVGWDVSLKETSIVGSGPTATGFGASRVLVGPTIVAEMVRNHAPYAVLVVFETGPLATWFHRELTADSLPAVCIDARHAKAALDTAPNKTDANDADGLALLGPGRFPPGGSRQKPRGDAAAGTDRRPQSARRHRNRALEPYARHHEDV